MLSKCTSESVETDVNFVECSYCLIARGIAPTANIAYAFIDGTFL